jgi:hypothetical protein
MRRENGYLQLLLHVGVEALLVAEGAHEVGGHHVPRALLARRWDLGLGVHVLFLVK